MLSPGGSGSTMATIMGDNRINRLKGSSLLKMRLIYAD